MNDHRLIHPEPGDTIVLTVSNSTSQEESASIHHQMRSMFPDNGVLILNESVWLGGNRWAAFTDDELDLMLHQIGGTELMHGLQFDLYREVEAELERRKDTT